MRKVLTLSFNSGQKYTGGMQCSQRNRESLREIFGKENTHEYIIKPYNPKRTLKVIYNRIIDATHGFMGGMNLKLQKELLDYIENHGITDVFVDSSLLGAFAKKVKQRFPKVRVVTFFHNIEIEYVIDALKVSKDFFHWYWYPSTKYNEQCAIDYSDIIIALNERDSNALKSKYNRAADILIPISFRDYAKHIDKNIKNEKKTALFLGSYFFANIEGITWFCENVLPFIDIELYIVGASMNRLPDNIKREKKVKIFSDVPDLTKFFENADFMILPIFSGSGMKVKTAESLMNGKYILGTKEAFMGYEITSDCGIECNSAEDFIKAINNLNLKYKFNDASYQLYLNKYSFDSTLKKFQTVYK